MEKRAKIIENLKYISAHWKWYFAFGIALVVAGFLAINISIFTTLLSVVFLGSVLIFSGVLEIFYSFRFKNWSTSLLHMLLGILYVISGGFMIYQPIVNALGLTLVLSVFFIIGGLFRIYFAITSNLANRGWLFINGILTLFLGLLIWHQWPASGLWILGLFIGIDMIFAGWTWIILSFQAKNILLEIAKNELATRQRSVERVTKPEFKNIIDAANEAILACKNSIQNCYSTTTSTCNNPENCGASYQKVIETCKRNLHECNLLLNNKKYENEKQKNALINLKNISEECEKKCNEALLKIKDKNFNNGCVWAMKVCNDCIAIADECIESFS